MAAVDAGTVAATQRGGLTPLGIIDAGVGDREGFAERGVGEGVDQRGIVGQAVRAGLAQCFGAYVMALPG